MEPINIKFYAHLSDNYQLKQADELIKKLRIELGQANAYIDELESYHDSDRFNAAIEEYKHRAEVAEESLKKISIKYSIEQNKVLSVDDTYKKMKETIERLQDENKRITESRNQAIAEIVKLKKQ